MSMTKKSEDSLAFKTFLYCPIPGVDVLAGATVFAASAAAEACADGIKGAVKEGFREAVSDFQRDVLIDGVHSVRAIADTDALTAAVKDGMSEGLGEAIALSEEALQRQFEPLASGLGSLATAIGNLAAKPAGTDTSTKP